MLGEPHDLMHEFPEYAEKIGQLRVNDNSFAEIMKNYDALDTRIRELEGLGAPVADETLEDLKKERVQMKDTLYTLLKG